MLLPLSLDVVYFPYYYYGAGGFGFFTFFLVLILFVRLIQICCLITNSTAASATSMREVDQNQDLQTQAKLNHKAQGLCEPLVQSEKVKQPFTVRWQQELELAFVFIVIMIPYLTLMMLSILVIVCADELRNGNTEIFFEIVQYFAYIVPGVMILTFVLTLVLMSCQMAASNKARNSLFGGEAVFQFRHVPEAFHEFTRQRLHSEMNDKSWTRLVVQGLVLPWAFCFAVPVITLLVLHFTGATDGWSAKEQILYYGLPSVGCVFCFVLLLVYALFHVPSKLKMQYQRYLATRNPPVTLLGKNCVYANDQFLFFDGYYKVLYSVTKNVTEGPPCLVFSYGLKTKYTYKQKRLIVFTNSDDMADSVISLNMYPATAYVITV